MEPSFTTTEENPHRVGIAVLGRETAGEDAPYATVFVELLDAGDTEARNRFDAVAALIAQQVAQYEKGLEPTLTLHDPVANFLGCVAITANHVLNAAYDCDMGREVVRGEVSKPRRVYRLMGAGKGLGLSLELLEISLDTCPVSRIAAARRAADQRESATLH
jgi:hypothetical protein